jgi:hypothetical protein
MSEGMLLCFLHSVEVRIPFVLAHSAAEAKVRTDFLGRRSPRKRRNAVHPRHWILKTNGGFFGMYFGKELASIARQSSRLRIPSDIAQACASL